MSENPIQGIIDTTMENIRAMTDADTIIGDPITVDGGVTLIPVSKVSFGFASGGSDFPSKKDDKCFGGGGGAGITITPIAFIAVTNGEVRMMNINTGSSTPEKLIGLVPEVFDKISAMIKKGKEKKAEKQAEEAAGC